MARLGAALMVLVLTACNGASSGEATIPALPPPPATTSPPTATTTAAASGLAQGCADVIDATIEPGAAGFEVTATVTSADTGWDKYADAWQVVTLDETVLGERILTHPHETEQPFTRSLSPVEIPPHVAEVVIVARDSVAGFCGTGFTVQVPHP